jgi:hypothetical protein
VNARHGSFNQMTNGGNVILFFFLILKGLTLDALSVSACNKLKQLKHENFSKLL